MKLKGVNTENKYVGTIVNGPNGITLIALVITIIILIILAGVAINLTLGENGIFVKAKYAKEETLKANATEKVKLAILASYDKEGILIYGDISNVEGLESNINKIEGLSSKITSSIESFPVNIIVDGYEFEIQSDGKIELIENDNSSEDNDTQTVSKYTLLRHFDEEDSKILKSSVSLSNTTKKYGEASAYFNNNNYIEYASDSNLLSGDFTIDYWYYEEEQFTTGYAPHIDFGNYGLSFGIYNGNFTILQQMVGFIEADIPQMEAKKWTHIAIVRQGTTMYVFLDGILNGTYTVSGTLSTTSFTIGKDVSTNYLLDAYIDELRITKGNAIWTSNFTVPNKEYTKLEGEYIEHFNTVNELAVRENEGNATISKDIKKMGNGSIYLNSSYYKINQSDDLKFENDFTIDYWYYQTSYKTDNSYHIVSSNENGIWMGINEGKFRIRTRGNGVSYTQFFQVEQAPINTWTHIALTRKNGIMYFFVNGELQGTFEYSNTIENGDLYLGYDLYNYTTDTYIDELRILKDEAIWTEDFIPQTIPYKD